MNILLNYFFFINIYIVIYTIIYIYIYIYCYVYKLWNWIYKQNKNKIIQKIIENKIYKLFIKFIFEPYLNIIFINFIINNQPILKNFIYNKYIYLSIIRFILYIYVSIKILIS